jgi:hypothetical protein
LQLPVVAVVQPLWLAAEIVVEDAELVGIIS